MDDSNNIVLTTINDCKNDLKNFKQNIGADRDKFLKIKVALKELQSLDKILKDLQQLCINEDKALTDLCIRLNDIQRDELYDKTDDMYNAIAINLPKGMELLEDNISGRNENQFFISLNKKRKILNEGKYVGEINVVDYTDMGLKIEVKINENEDNFYVDEPLRVYNIISFILTKFNYE